MANTYTELKPLTAQLVNLSENHFRTATDARLVTSRAYNFHQDKHEGKASEHVDTPFAYASLIIYAITFTATIIFWRKNTNPDFDTDKIYFEMRDALAAFCFNLFRIQGEYCGNLDAVSEWANVTEEISKNILVSMFVFDMLHKLYFDLKSYYKNELEILNINLEIELTIDSLQKRKLEVLRDQLLLKRFELSFVNGFCNLIYFSMLITGAAAGSVGLIALGTMANQLKNWLVCARDWYRVIDQCYKKDEYLNNLQLSEIKEEDRQKINFELIELGMDQISDHEFTETGLSKYKQRQKDIMAEKIAKAHQKFILDTLWYGLLITTIGLLATSSATVSVSLGSVLAAFNFIAASVALATPLGLTVFVFGALAYGAIKTGVYVYESSTSRPVLNSMNSQNPELENYNPMLSSERKIDP